MKPKKSGSHHGAAEGTEEGFLILILFRVSVPPWRLLTFIECLTV